MRQKPLILLLGLLLAPPLLSGASDPSDALTDALNRSQNNRVELEKALRDVPAAERKGMEFLIVNMPDRDLTELSADFLLENVAFAYRVRTETPWGKSIPERIFLNDVLPYVSINERRDRWRKDFYTRFLPLVKDCDTAALAATRLNQKIFPVLNVHYSTQRPKADQSPYESTEAGMASCTGLSILLIDACRAVGVPARFVGTPLWANQSGNHSWVEIWDNGWHFTGAAEPTGDELNKAWFVGRAKTARQDEPQHAIYATCFERTTRRFPLVWDLGIDYVPATNVTRRYTADERTEHAIEETPTSGPALEGSTK